MAPSKGTAGAGRYSSEQLNRVAGLYVSGTAGVLLASAGRDVNLTAAVLQASGAQGNVQVQAGRDLNMGTVNTGSLTDLNWDAHNRLRMDRREETGTRITGGGDVTLRAGQDITGRAIQVQAGGDLSAVAERNVVIEAGEATFEVDAASRTKSRGPVSSKTTTTKITHRSAQAQVSQLQGRTVEVLGTNVVSVGTRIQGQDGVHIEGTDHTLLYAAQDRSFTQVDVTTKRSSVVGPKYRKTESTDIQFSDVGIGTELLSDEAVRIGVGERTELIGARVSAPSIEFTRSENAAPDAAGELLLGAVVEKDVHSHQSKTVTDGVWQKVISKGHETETLKSTELHGQVRFDPSLAISVQIPAGAPRQHIEQLVQQPGLEYLQALAQREDIDWQAIELAQRQWNDKQQGLTGAGAAILVLVVAFFTAGMGTELAIAASGSTTGATATALTTTTAAGVTGYTAAGAAINAGFTSLASTAAVSFVNNGGDLGAVFKDLGSNANVKQLITGMVTAGIVNSLASQLTVGGKQLGSITAKDGFTSYFSKSLIEQSTSAVVNSALNGVSLQDGLQAALISSALGSATALGANAIGDLGLLQDLSGQPVLNPAGKALLHALLGCAGGAAQAGSTGCAAGASGAVLGELAAAWYDPTGNKPRAETEAFAAAVAGMGGVLAGDESGLGVNIAAAAGRNAAANNYLNHVEAQRLAALKMQRLQGRCDSACDTDIRALEALDAQRNRTLAACEGSSTPACQAARQEVQVAAAQYIRANDPSLDLRYRQEQDETLALARNAMGGVNLANVARGFGGVWSEGAQALIDGAQILGKALQGDAVAQQALREGAADAWGTVQDPANWPLLLGAMSPQQREALAQAYERGDIQTVGRMMGEQVANLPSGGGMGSIKKVGTLPKPGASSIDIAHTIGADYNPRNGKVTGGHTVINGDVRVTEVIAGPDANGVYIAKVEMKTPDGRWVEKVSNNGENTMFPKDWDSLKVQAEIESAWANRVPHMDGTAGKWQGLSSSGVKMEGYESPRATAYPVHGAQK
ncbi:MAG: hypothetical protein DCF26_20520 [Burkholderiales bacterium]|nr:MAG: hypothetical protein DCF26_20520 [Burkholderiales bacterium]